MTQILDILGNCPMGCGPHLHRLQTGAVKCLARDCPEPLAAQYILNETETEHLVYLEEDSWQALHPLRERINGALLTCGISQAAEQAHSFGMEPGGYRVTVTRARGSETWHWEPLRGDRGEGEQEEAGDAAPQAAAEPEKRDEAEPHPPQPQEQDQEAASVLYPRGRGSPAFP
jgi:hypothetical protein